MLCGLSLTKVLVNLHCQCMQVSGGLLDAMSGPKTRLN